MLLLLGCLGSLLGQFALLAVHHADDLEADDAGERIDEAQHQVDAVLHRPGLELVEAQLAEGAGKDADQRVHDVPKVNRSRARGKHNSQDSRPPRWTRPAIRFTALPA